VSRLVEVHEAMENGQIYLGQELFANQGNQRFVLFPKIVEMVRREASSSMEILEIGTWAGGSLIGWDAAANHNAHFTVVDQWKPYYFGPPRNTEDDSHYEMDKICSSGDIERLFWHNIKVAGILDRVTFVRGDSRIVLPTLGDGIFDIVFIDGDHSYEFVKSDINQAKRLIRLGGFIVGDDLERQLPSVASPYHRTQIELKNHFGNASSDGYGYHPGVTQAVWEEFGQVSNPMGLWAVQKTETGWNVNVI